ncbi:hypothetical protein [Tenacibaculum piscium]|uniref:Uncharacterized protein n=1 Tax=Tenacibaculum piscium TaxID=1458515 RepID=A0A2H1YKM5_9FLAO|nr:hypothetical protein [Tenacibaculum piscium]MBE7628567.1 hypothetical protein [Tenacibaculum piscium]MBE7669708.1 hypothetical protein [Tenacibaculum piscium]MBE7684704.1 hypothetical protein [Tenacibaculum piscium]MBE7689324.1 hypothetical protein [Tenacibaculum piscium]MCG8182797.1 hypothetical protein [Tenacibaculum piscium]
MSLSKNIQKGSFWINVLKVSVPFLVFVTLFSLLVNSGSALFSGDFETVNTINFSQGKWQRFWLTKVTVSVLYAIYVVNKKTK